MYNTQKAKSYGFVTDRSIYDEARRSKSSTYAKAMGAFSIDDITGVSGNCWWWLRSPGDVTVSAALVKYDGLVNNVGDDVDFDHGVRPALNLNLSSSNLWCWAGTVCSDGTVDESPYIENESGQTETSSTTGNENISESNNSKSEMISNVQTSESSSTVINVSKISISGISHNIAAGKKFTLKAVVSPNNAANKKLVWSSSNKKVATVSQSGVVTMKKNTGGKSVMITAKAVDGSGTKASWKIKVMKGVVKKVSVSGAKTVTAGKSLKLKVKVTATKGANKKLKWISSNPKYATVSSSGKVKTLKAGKGKKVKVTAMATDGSNKKKTVVIKIK